MGIARLAIFASVVEARGFAVFGGVGDKGRRVEWQEMEGG
jgi:hypothetical protein